MKLAVCQEKSAAGDVPGAIELLRRRALAAAAAGTGLRKTPVSQTGASNSMPHP